MAKVKEKKIVSESKVDNAAHLVLVEPMITEKSHQLMSENKYVFVVSKESNKKMIEKAVAGQYNVKVEKVSIINIHPKKRVYGRTVGWKSGYKKAIVKLKEGDKIELFEGV